ncbi:MAG: hypothetical protein KBD60_12180 [Sterolibacterium sp.]|nr:hypothetical protein [Sterolibacterium sp.]
MGWVDWAKLCLIHSLPVAMAMAMATMLIRQIRQMSGFVSPLGCVNIPPLTAGKAIRHDMDIE